MYHPHDDEETGICTEYHPYFEGIEVDFNDSWRPGATCLLESGEEELLFTTIDCPKVLHWTPSELKDFWGSVEIEYLEHGYMRREVLATEEEADQIASQAVYDKWGEACIAVTRTLSVGRSTVWLNVERHRRYNLPVDVDVCFRVEFANSEDCTRFLHEDMSDLACRGCYDNTGGAVPIIDAIVDALFPFSGEYDIAAENAAQRGLPHSQFLDECPQPDKQLIHHRASNWGDDRPCFLTLHLTTENLFYITRVDWCATTIPPTLPSPSGGFQSLNNLHLKFPLHGSQGHNSSHQDDLTITISTRGITFLDGTNSVSAGNSFSINSVHRTVTINYINTVMGDGYFGAISGGNIGGRNNVNSSPPTTSNTAPPTNLLTMLRSPSGALTEESSPDTSPAAACSEQSNTATSLIEEAIPEPTLPTVKTPTGNLALFAILIAIIVFQSTLW